MSLPIVAALTTCGGRIAPSGSLDASARWSNMDAHANFDSPIGDAGDAEIDAIFDDVWCEAGHAVGVCVEYYAVLTACFQHDYGTYACADPLVPKTDADLSGIEGLCAFHLRLSRHACP